MRRIVRRQKLFYGDVIRVPSPWRNEFAFLFRPRRVCNVEVGVYLKAPVFFAPQSPPLTIHTPEMAAQSVPDLIFGRGDDAAMFLLLALQTAPRSASRSRAEGTLPVPCAQHPADPRASTSPTNSHLDVGAELCVPTVRSDAPHIMETCFSEMNLTQLNLLLALGHSLPGTRSILSYVPSNSSVVCVLACFLVCAVLHVASCKLVPLPYAVHLTHVCIFPDAYPLDFWATWFSVISPRATGLTEALAALSLPPSLLACAQPLRMVPARSASSIRVVWERAWGDRLALGHSQALVRFERYSPHCRIGLWREVAPM